MNTTNKFKPRKRVELSITTQQALKAKCLFSSGEVGLNQLAKQYGIPVRVMARILY